MVKETINALAKIFVAERQTLGQQSLLGEPAWRKICPLVLRRYRAFFEGLLSG